MEAGKALRGTPADVVVVDRQNHHCFQPLLYQVATAALSPADVAWPIRHILRAQANVTVLMEEVHGVNPSQKLLHTNFGDVTYDYLVIATGAMHSYFGHDEWADYAPGLKRIEDATRIRRSILIAFEQAELMTDAAAQRRLLTFVIVGGGATGVEMAGARGGPASISAMRAVRGSMRRKSAAKVCRATSAIAPTITTFGLCPGIAFPQVRRDEGECRPIGGQLPSDRRGFSNLQL